MSARRTGAIACIVVLLVGCHKTVTVSPDQYGTLKGGKRAVVITTSGHEYEYRSFRIEQQEFIGSDGKEKGPTPGPAPSRIPLAEIAVLKVQKIHAAKTAVLVGGVTAATIAIIIAIAAATVEPFGDGETTSCPLVFSFDGTDYRFDSETYAGAIFAGAERTDYDNLDFLVPVGGQYRLQLRNTRPETQYTNQLALLVVDHPGGTRVLPDARGGLHALDQLLPPSSVSDYANRDVRSLVSQQDDMFWESDLSARSFRDEQEFRDGINLTFVRPVGSKSAKLLIRARNTELGPFALREFLELQGQGLYRWYREANTSESLQRQMREWFFRDGMLLVKLWEEGKWVLQDALPDVGPAISKDLVATLDLSRVRGNKVRIKLESLTGLWRIDAVALGFSTDEPIHVTELAPTWVQTQDGRDIRSTLSRDDGLYYIALPGDYADIVFAEPPMQPDYDRTYILKSKGFYYIYVDDSGPARPELAHRIVNETGMAARYFLPRWAATEKRKSR